MERDLNLNLNFLVSLCVLLHISILVYSQLPHIKTPHPFRIHETLHNSTLYEVYKIDSINNYYLIYLKEGNNRYKVISKMTFRIQSEKIRLNKKYKFTLESIFNVDLYINGVNVNPALAPNVECISIDNRTNICIERKDSIYDLFRAINLDGLYIKK